LSHQLAVELIDAWRRFGVDDMTLPLVDSALWIKAAHRLSYWDCAIVAAARALGCRRLYSEDMSHGLEIEGVRIVNPFR
jgi:predicted nucleic acid-binding protein